MIKAERHSKICELLEAMGTVSVSDAAESLGVSDMTIRRDLDELSEQGFLERVHGGARKVTRNAAPTLTHEYSHTEKRTRNAEAKLAIARAAVALIGEGETVFLGAGTTIEQMVGLLPPCQLRIVTNSLSVFNLLQNRDDYELCLVGGLFRRRTAAFVGPMAEEAVSSLGIDVAFVGANGVADGTISTSNMEEGKLQQLVLDKAARRYVVADASKLGRRDFYSFYRLCDVAALISDEACDEAARTSVAELTQLVIA